MDGNAKKVLDVMKKTGEPMRPGDIASAANMEKKELDKIIKTLKSDGLIHSPKRCFYEPV